MLEAQFKEKDAVYSKEMLYMDPEMWRCLQKVTWDRQGRVWRQFFFHTEIVTDEEMGITMPHTFEIYSCDLQRRHGSPSLDKVRELGLKLDKRFWSVQTLLDDGY